MRDRPEKKKKKCLFLPKSEKKKKREDRIHVLPFTKKWEKGEKSEPEPASANRGGGIAAYVLVGRKGRRRTKAPTAIPG